MTLQLALAIFGAGFVLLALGGEGVIRGGVMLKRVFGISPVIIGLFALSLGTASPALAVSIQAAASNQPDLVVGTVIGAVLINLLLVLGLGALIRPMPSPPKVVLRDGGTLLLAAAALAVLSLTGAIARQQGVLLLGAFLVYAIVAILTDWRRPAEHSVCCAEAEKRMTGEHPTLSAGLFVLIIGIVCLVIGSRLLVGATLSLSALWRIPLSALALTAVALAVSLPVLGVTAVAALRGHTQIAIGHLIAASIFELFAVLGIAAMVRPLAISRAFAGADVYVVLGAVLLLLPLVSANWRLSRPRGAILFLAYVGYVGYLAWREGLLPAFGA